MSSIDFAIVENVNLLSIKTLEDIDKHFSKFRQTGYIESNNALFKVLKQINLIIDNYSSSEDDHSFYNEYVELRKLIVDWVIECFTKAEADNQE